MCVKKGNTFKCFWLFLRKRGEGGWSQEGICAPVVARVAHGQDHTEALRSGCCWGRVPLPAPVLQPLTPCAPRGGEGSPCPEWALGGSGTFESSAQGGVGRDGRPQDSMLWAGQPHVRVSSELGQCRMRGQDGQPGFPSSLGPQGRGGVGRGLGRCSGSQQRFGSSWQSGGRAGVHAGGAATRGQGSVGCPGWAAGCNTRFPEGVTRQSQRTQRCPGLNLLQVDTQTGALASSAQEPEGCLLPTGSAQHTLLMRPVVRSVVGSLWCPGRYVNEGGGVL